MPRPKPSKIDLGPPRKAPTEGNASGRRATKTDETRRALFAAAAAVVGKHGYEGASVARITELAGVAAGTFYNYFPTRQDLFDQLLPAIGQHLLDHIAQRDFDPSAKGADSEHERVAAYFEYFERNRGFSRVLNEAVVFAPRAFKLHVRDFAGRYGNVLKAQRENGETIPISDDLLEATAYVFLGARAYLTMMVDWAPASARQETISDAMAAYLQLVRRGLFATGSSGS